MKKFDAIDLSIESFLTLHLNQFLLTLYGLLRLIGCVSTEVEGWSLHRTRIRSSYSEFFV